MRTELKILGRVPGMNEFMKWHWSKKHRLRQTYQLDFMSQTRNRHPGKVRIEIFRHSSGVMDRDNLVSTAKLLLDAMKQAEIIVDDSPSIVESLEVKHVKVSHKVLACAVIVVQDAVQTP